DWTGPRPALFIPHVVASRSLSRLLRALPAQPSREAARWGRVAARNQTRRLRPEVSGHRFKWGPRSRLGDPQINSSLLLPGRALINARTPRIIYPLVSPRTTAPATAARRWMRCEREQVSASRPSGDS